MRPYRGGGMSTMDDFFNQQLERFFGINPYGGGLSSRSGGSGQRSSSLPAVNIQETADAFDIQVAAPGMKKDDFDIDVTDGTLTISAETKSESEDKSEGDDEKGGGYHRREFSYSSFQRRFQLPDNVREEDIKASYEDGILKLELPKLEPEEQAPKSRRIEIG